MCEMMVMCGTRGHEEVTPQGRVMMMMGELEG